MIPKSEILELATQASLQAHVIEKDYLLGWLIAGIHQHPVIGKDWVFKGGTCLKKCYFETYRFSEDLDFTIRGNSRINVDFLRGTFTEIAEWIYEQSGIEIPTDRLKFENYTNPRGVESCQGRVYYKGPATFSGKQSMPRIKLDLSTDEIVVDDPVIMPVRHDYSDSPDDGISIRCYSYAEVFAEKIRALKERTRPRDLYDVITFYRRPESREVASDVRSILEKKCDFKKIAFPASADLDLHRDLCAAGWDDQLGHQLPFLPPFETYWGELPTFFSWIEHPESIPDGHLAAIPSQHVGEATTIALEPGSPFFTTLERVRFAAVNRLCVGLDYRKDGGAVSTCLVEPYSLRTTSDGNMVLYGAKLPTGEILCLRTDSIVDAGLTRQPFTPRFSIEFIPEGPARLSARRVTSNSLAQARRASSPKNQAPLESPRRAEE